MTAEEQLLARFDDLLERFDRTEQERSAWRAHHDQAINTLSRTVAVVSETVESIEQKLGEEPDSDGNGGRGLIGDVRKQHRDIQGLLNLRSMAVGAVAAVSLFGALIIAGVIHFIQNIAHAPGGHA